MKSTPLAYLLLIAFIGILQGCRRESVEDCQDHSPVLDSLVEKIAASESSADQVANLRLFRTRHSEYIADSRSTKIHPSPLIYSFLDSTGVEVSTLSKIMEAKWMLVFEAASCPTFKRFIIRPTDALNIEFMNQRLTEDCLGCEDFNK